MSNSRCCGLTEERRRCANRARAATDFCEQHARDARDQRALAPEPSVSARILARWRGNSARVPDNAEFDIPFWLRRGSTLTVARHLLNDPNARVRWLAAFTFRKRREPQAIEPLWHALQNDVVALVRQQAAVALGKIGTPRVTSPLIEALWHDRDPGVRQACAIALGNLGCAFAARDLVQALEREQTIFVSWDCVLALGQIGNSSIAPILAQIARTHRAAVVRHACAEAIAEIQRRASD